MFDWSGCSSTKLNHPLLLIGYGSTYVDNVNTEYWLLKNRCACVKTVMLFIYMHEPFSRFIHLTLYSETIHDTILLYCLINV